MEETLTADEVDRGEIRTRSPFFQRRLAGFSNKLLAVDCVPEENLLHALPESTVGKVMDGGMRSLNNAADIALFNRLSNVARGLPYTYRKTPTPEYGNACTTWDTT